MGKEIQWEKADIVDIVEALKRNDSNAFSEFYNRTYKMAYSIAINMLKKEDDVQDLLQDSYLTVINKIDMVREPERAISWFNMIVGNKCKDYIKRKKPIFFNELNNEDEDFEEHIENEYMDFVPEKAIDYSETKRLMGKILDSLSDDQKLCVLMYYYEELTVKEIAEALECSENTVKSRLNYARKKIREEVLELEKKGTKLYSIAPIPFIIWMLKEKEKMVEPPLLSDLTLSKIKSLNAKSNDGGTILSTGKKVKASSAAAAATSKSLGAKLIAGLLAITIVFGGGAIIKNKSDASPDMTPEQIEEKIISQLDYEFLEKLFYYLPIYGEADPVTENEMYTMMQYSTLYLYMNATESLDMPTFFDNDQYIMIDSEADRTYEGVFGNYIKVRGDQFNEIRRIIGFDKEINEEFFNTIDPYNQMMWEDGCIITGTDGLGGLFTDWQVEIVDTRPQNGIVEVDYILTMTDYRYFPQKVFTSERTAVFELTESGYIISSVREKDETQAKSIVEECNYLG
ncbi:MAG: sigma-70 family RNA polymerase sigma factor [Firmicutes bacterium]|nr:sigma-70 family RNA polymerase sigma factor [Bacillota bacterium]